MSFFLKYLFKVNEWKFLLVLTSNTWINKLMKKSLLAIFFLIVSVSLNSQPTESYKKSLEAIKINPIEITLDGKFQQ